MIIESVFIKKLLAKIFAQIGTAAWKSARSKNVSIIQILKPFGLSKLENNLKSIYAHTIVDLAIEGESKPVLELFEKEEIKTAFENSWIEPENDDFQQSVAEAIEIYIQGDEIKKMGVSAGELAVKFTCTFEHYVKKVDPGHALLSNEHKQLSQDLKRIEKLILERLGSSEKETSLPDLPLNPLSYFAHSRPLEKLWVGREEELTEITNWYQDEAVKVIGLVGFGGVGKSAMARQWLEGLQADGIFWWCFYREDSLDAFLESALKYFSGGQFRPEEARSAYARVRKLLEYIVHGHFILVLDGLEDMQKAKIKGNNFGEMKEREFTDLLQLWANGDHDSLLLITTRCILKDLQPYEEQSYRFITPEFLSAEDARELMRKRGVKGEDKALDAVANKWDNHALSLTLIAGFLKHYGGDITHVSEIPFEALERDEKVGLILTAYKNQLGPAEQVFMPIFSVFRYEVEKDAFASVFHEQIPDFDNQYLVELKDFDFHLMLEHLENLGLISKDKHGDHIAYSTHPLIHRYYYEHLEKKSSITLHRKVAQYYEKKAHTNPKTLDDLTYAIEAFHHTIQAGDYDKADEIYRQKINIRNEEGNFLITHNLGAFELDLSLISQLFPDGDTSQDPVVTSANERTWLIGEIGGMLMMLGRLEEAIPFFQRNIQVRLANNKLASASIGSRNLCFIYLSLGNLAEGKTAALQALNWARKVEDKWFELVSLAFLAYAVFLQGKNNEAGNFFDQANELERKLFQQKWLISLRGNEYAEFLARSGEKELAEKVTKENLKICQSMIGPHDIAGCYRLLAGLNLEDQDNSPAERYLNEGLQIARNIDSQEEIAKLHLGFARLYLARQELPKADSALKETLSICTRCGYKIIEIDARNVLAQVYQAAAQPSLARTEAETALSMSEKCGYHWGKIDAQEILNQL